MRRPNVIAAIAISGRVKIGPVTSNERKSNNAIQCDTRKVYTEDIAIATRPVEI